MISGPCHFGKNIKQKSSGGLSSRLPVTSGFPGRCPRQAPGLTGLSVESTLLPPLYWTGDSQSSCVVIPPSTYVHSIFWYVKEMSSYKG